MVRLSPQTYWNHRYLRKVDCSSFVMCRLLALPLRRPFLRWPPTVLARQTRQAVCAINQSIFLRCLWNKPKLKQSNYYMSMEAVRQSDFLRCLWVEPIQIIFLSSKQAATTLSKMALSTSIKNVTLSIMTLKTFMLSVVYAECRLCWMSQISPLCWESLCWVSLCWMLWRSKQINYNIQ